MAALESARKACVCPEAWNASAFSVGRTASASYASAAMKPMAAWGSLNIVTPLMTPLVPVVEGTHFGAIGTDSGIPMFLETVICVPEFGSRQNTPAGFEKPATVSVVETPQP